jgi:hypothetical protein
MRMMEKVCGIYMIFALLTFEKLWVSFWEVCGLLTTYKKLEWIYIYVTHIFNFSKATRKAKDLVNKSRELLKPFNWNKELADAHLVLTLWIVRFVIKSNGYLWRCQALTFIKLDFSHFTVSRGKFRREIGNQGYHGGANMADMRKGETRSGATGN